MNVFTRQNSSQNLKRVRLNGSDLFSNHIPDFHNPAKFYVQDSTTSMYAVTLDVSTIDGKCIKPQVNMYDSVIDLKKALIPLVDIPASKQYLANRNKPVDDDHSIYDLVFRQEHKLIIYEVKQQEMCIRTSDGGKKELEVSTTNTVSDILNTLASQEGLLPMNLDLRFKDKILDKDELIGLCGLKEGCKEELELLNNVTNLTIIIQSEKINKPISIGVQSCDTIKWLKTKICELEGIPVKDQILICNDEIFDDESTLFAYSNCCIEMNVFCQIRGQRYLNITVSTLTGKSLDIKAHPSQTVEDLKFIVQVLEGIPKDQQRMIFAGIQLEDIRTLESYNIVNFTKIHLVLRLRGGGTIMYVLNKYGQSVSIEIYSSDTVDDVKARIEARTGIPPKDQVLVIYDERIMGKQTEDLPDETNENSVCHML